MLAMSHSAAEHGVLSNLEYDINHVTANDSFRGLGLFKNAVTVLLQGSLAVPTLWGSSLSRIGPVSLPNFIIFPVAWALINKFSLDKLTAKVNSLEKQQEHLAIKADNIVYSDLTQSKTITLRGERALQQVAARQEEARDNIVALQKRVSNWSIFQGSARSLMQNCNTIVFFAIAGYSVVTRRFDPVNLFVTSRLVDNLYTLLFWGKDNGVAIRRQEVAIGRLSRFLEREEELRATPPSVKYKRDSQGNVILDKLSLSINGSSLLYIPYQQLECGGSYVLTGEKGTGKSSLLAKIMGVTQDGIRANGTITTADLTTIMSISQDNFLPAYATIFDAMCFPQQAPAAGSKDRAQMLKLAKQLLEEARIDHGNDKDNRNSIANNLELVAPDWNNSLSGGQKKIVQVVAAILQKPKIVLLDELFAGMDKATIQIIQRMLRQHLPHTTFITVDHNAGENNHPIHPPGKAERYFYDCELHIKNQRLSSNSDGIGFTR